MRLASAEPCLTRPFGKILREDRHIFQTRVSLNISTTPIWIHSYFTVEDSKAPTILAKQFPRPWGTMTSVVLSNIRFEMAFKDASMSATVSFCLSYHPYLIQAADSCLDYEILDTAPAAPPKGNRQNEISSTVSSLSYLFAGIFRECRSLFTSSTSESQQRTLVKQSAQARSYGS